MVQSMGTTVQTGQMADLHDVLSERRESSDMMWVSREWVPVAAYIQPHKSSASDIKTSVLKSRRLKQVVEEMSEEEHVSREELYKQVDDILQEMGYNRQLPVLRWLALFTAKLLKKLCHQVLVSEEALLKVKSELGGHPVLFVPSHRSYGDFILMSYVCFHYELDIPRIAAAMDFHGMALMGRILRDACAFFIRRSFSRDKLYSAIFSQYVQTLVTEGDAALEFFIEGTRSRTGKALPPKFGFLTTALQPFLAGLVPDISVVPVNIAYDRPLEEVLFAYEMLGVPKPKESTKGLVKALSILNSSHGNVYVRFGEAISARRHFAGVPRRPGLGPARGQAPSPLEVQGIVTLAHDIVERQQDLGVLGCFNLLACVLNEGVVQGVSPLGVGLVVERVGWLREVLEALGAPVYIGDNVRASVLSSLALHSTLVVLDPVTQVVRLRLVHTPGVESPARPALDLAVPLIMLQHYVNPCCCWFAPLSLMLCALQCSHGNAAVDTLFHDFCFLRSVFSHEFVFHKDTARRDFHRVLKKSESLRLISISNDLVSLGQNTLLSTFCSNFLAPFVPGYLAIAQYLLQSSEFLFSEREVVKATQLHLEAQLSTASETQGSIHPASLSLNMLSNALQGAVAVEALIKDRSNDELKYSINKEKLRDFERKLLLLDGSRNVNLELARQFSTFINGKL